jgi:hypothetical protein
LARAKELANGIQGGVFHDQDHHGRGEDRRQDQVLELVRQMASFDHQFEVPFRPDWNPPHRGSPLAITYDVGVKIALCTARVN